MQYLNKTVLAGGVVYPAGTPATEELLDRIQPKHWDGTPETPVEPAPNASEQEQGQEAEVADEPVVEMTPEEQAAAEANAAAPEVTPQPKRARGRAKAQGS